MSDADLQHLSLAPGIHRCIRCPQDTPRCMQCPSRMSPSLTLYPGGWLAVCGSTHLAVSVGPCLSVAACPCLSLSVSAWLSVFVDPSVGPSRSGWIVHMSVSASFCMSVCRYVCQSVCQSLSLPLCCCLCLSASMPVTISEYIGSLGYRSNSHWAALS